MRAKDQDVAGRHRQELGEHQQRVSIGPLQVVERQHHRPIRRRVGYQSNDSAVQPAARVGRVEVRHLRGFAEHLDQLGHEVTEDACESRRPTQQICPPPVALGRTGGLHRAHDFSERFSQCGVRGRRAFPASPVGEHTVASGDLEPEGLRQRRLAHAGSPAEQNATAAYASGLRRRRRGVRSVACDGRRRGRRGRVTRPSSLGLHRHSRRPPDGAATGPV